MKIKTSFLKISLFLVSIKWIFNHQDRMDRSLDHNEIIKGLLILSIGKALYRMEIQMSVESSLKVWFFKILGDQLIKHKFLNTCNNNNKHFRIFIKGGIQLPKTHLLIEMVKFLRRDKWIIRVQQEIQLGSLFSNRLILRAQRVQDLILIIKIFKVESQQQMVVLV
jgi:hypothetical protein